jgi:hypothetical protein
MTTSDGGLVDRKKPGRTRTHFSKADDRELLLRAAFREIAASDPPKLRQIVARVENVRRLASSRGDKADKVTKAIAADALAIIERAERRLAWFDRQGEKA